MLVLASRGERACWTGRCAEMQAARHGADPDLQPRAVPGVGDRERAGAIVRRARSDRRRRRLDRRDARRSRRDRRSAAAPHQDPASRDRRRAERGSRNQNARPAPLSHFTRRAGRCSIASTHDPTARRAPSRRGRSPTATSTRSTGCSLATTAAGVKPQRPLPPPSVERRTRCARSPGFSGSWRSADPMTIRA